MRRAEEEIDDASRKTRKEVAKRERHDSLETKPVGRPPDFEKRVEEAAAAENKTADNLKRARENKLRIGRVYHPYDIETGRRQNTETVEARLEACFAKIDDATEGLSERCVKHMGKARKVVGKIKATTAFFFSMISVRSGRFRFSYCAS